MMRCNSSRCLWGCGGDGCGGGGSCGCGGGSGGGGGDAPSCLTSGESPAMALVALSIGVESMCDGVGGCTHRPRRVEWKQRLNSFTPATSATAMRVFCLSVYIS